MFDVLLLRYLEYLLSQELSDMSDRLKRASIGQRTFIRASDRHFNDSFTADIERLFGDTSTGSNLVSLLP